MIRYQGLDPVHSAEPVVLTPSFVDIIHKHIPIEMLVREEKHTDTDGVWWKAVRAATGQPARFE
jgi:hypothetical protein